MQDVPDAASPGSIPARVAAAIGLQQNGMLDAAAALYVAVLQEDPQNVTALHFLGVLHHQKGRSAMGIDLIRLALNFDPKYVDAYSNLGNIFHDIGYLEEASKAYKLALELRPGHPPAVRNLGIVGSRLREFEDSVQALGAAIEREPGEVQNRYELATVYRKAGRHDEAIEVLKQAVAIKPEAVGYFRLGNLLYARKRVDEARENYQAWLRREPDHPVAKHMLAACTRDDVPQRASDEYVTQIFDGFADSFDDVLRRLEYRAPALIGEAIRRVAGEPRAEFDIVDLGCGTGLLAEHLRPYARRLVGVDLSQKMLEKAAQRAAYDELVGVDLTVYLGSMQRAFDLIASSDTLVYFGELREVFRAAAAALRSGGRLLFTLERDDDPALDYRLHPHGRYSHTERYLRAALAEAGLELVELHHAPLRREGSAYVQGLVVVAAAP